MLSGLLLVVSIFAGCVGAMTSTGGGLILIPALTLCGVDIKHAIAVSALSLIVVSNTAASRYVRRHLPNLKVDTLKIGLLPVSESKKNTFRDAQAIHSHLLTSQFLIPRRKPRTKQDENHRTRKDKATN